MLKFTDPDFDWSEESPLDVTNIADVLATVECPLGDGVFAQDTIGGQTGFFWGNESDDSLAAWYTAVAEDGEITRLEETSSGVEVDVNLDSYDGVYPYHDRADTKARGTGKGTIFAEDCTELEETPYF